ncbi:MAG: hypothetical protein BMS9Abin19_1036 [Gammaproteobacteria bacterium]|nr:MAG: hypothetical protein BMS9Abin19_1036 [Gammaproteobacteria bacterium]
MDSESFNCLGETGVGDFLNHYWQKKPLLVRNAFPGIQSPLTADELAGLACEENVNARLVLEKDGDYPWQAEFGPFEETRFNNLPETHWSLLVSDVERLIPETKSLVKPFRFLPDWRLDDLMISYAPEGGSVGAHIDDYDVFLIQLSGQRLWKISEHYSDETLEDVDLRILKNFTAEEEWSLNAGDMLYLPPNVAHHGIAQASKGEQGNEEHCLTASVGFRAPSLKTITSDYVHFLNENTHTTTRYTDKSPVKLEHHAEISDDTVSQFIEYLQQGLTLDREHVKRWLGQYRSDNRAFEELSKNSSDVQHNISFNELIKLAEQSMLVHSSYSNFLFSYHQQTALLFIDGIAYEVSKQFAELLCEDDQINFQPLLSIMTADDKEVFLTLFNNGSIVISENT